MDSPVSTILSQNTTGQNSTARSLLMSISVYMYESLFQNTAGKNSTARSLLLNVYVCLYVRVSFIHIFLASQNTTGCSSTTLFFWSLLMCVCLFLYRSLLQVQTLAKFRPSCLFLYLQVSGSVCNVSFALVFFVSSVHVRSLLHRFCVFGLKNPLHRSL